MKSLLSFAFVFLAACGSDDSLPFTSNDDGGITGDGGGTLQGPDLGAVTVPTLDDAACANAVPVSFTQTSPDGHPRGAVLQALGGLVDEVPKLPCAPASSNGTSDGRDVVFRIELAQPAVLRVRAVSTDMDAPPTMALVGGSCANSPLIRCGESRNEYLDTGRLEAGTYFVVADGFAPSIASKLFYFDLLPALPPPPNDSCATAEDLVFTAGVARASGNSHTANNSNVGAPATSPRCDPLATYRQDIVYRFTISEAQDVGIEVRGDSQVESQSGTSVALQRTCGAPSSTDEIDCQTGPTASVGVNFKHHSLAAGTYFLWVEAGMSGGFEVKLTLSPPTTLAAEDTCAGATQLVPGVTRIMNTASVAANYPYGCGDYGLGSGGPDAVYTFTLTQPQKVTLTASTQQNRSADVTLAKSCAELVGGASCQTKESELVDWDLPAGTYYAMVKSNTNDPISFAVDLTLGTAMPIVANDTCASPKPIVFTGNQAQDSVMLGNANFNYAGSKCDPMYYQYNTGPDVVYSVPVPAGKTLQVTGQGPSQDPIIFTSGTICPTTIPELSCAIAGRDAPATLTYVNSTGASQNVLIVVQARQDANYLRGLGVSMNVTFKLL